MVSVVPGNAPNMWLNDRFSSITYTTCLTGQRVSTSSGEMVGLETGDVGAVVRLGAADGWGRSRTRRATDRRRLLVAAGRDQRLGADDRRTRRDHGAARNGGALQERASGDVIGAMRHRRKIAARVAGRSPNRPPIERGQSSGQASRSTE